MKIKLHIGHRLVLHGIPQGDGGLVLAVVVGIVFLAASAFFYPKTTGESLFFRVLMLLPAVVGAAIVIGVLILITFRERLELDKLTGNGTYER